MGEPIAILQFSNVNFLLITRVAKSAMAKFRRKILVGVLMYSLLMMTMQVERLPNTPTIRKML